MLIVPSDATLVDLVVRAYNPQPGDFDHLIQVDAMAAHIAVKHCDGYDVAVPIGSQTADDWARDALSEFRRGAHFWPGFEALGPLPYGFSMHLPQSYAALAAVLRADVPTAWAGHSLGGPEALHLAGAHRLHGGTILRLALFECPNPGTAMLAAFFANDDLDVWRNKGDPIPALPEYVPDIFPWVPVRTTPINFDLGPEPSLEHPLARHAVTLCQQAVLDAAQMPVAA